MLNNIWHKVTNKESNKPHRENVCNWMSLDELTHAKILLKISFNELDIN